ncbi:MAG: hypothetical protein ABEI99_11360 [Halobaculum sp.]
MDDIAETDLTEGQPAEDPAEIEEPDEIDRDIDSLDTEVQDLIDAILEESGETLRLAARYDRDDYEVVYAREDVTDGFSEPELANRVETFVMQGLGEPGQEQSLYDFGALEPEYTEYEKKDRRPHPGRGVDRSRVHVRPEDEVTRRTRREVLLSLSPPTFPSPTVAFPDGRPSRPSVLRTGTHQNSVHRRGPKSPPRTRSSGASSPSRTSTIASNNCMNVSSTSLLPLFVSSVYAPTPSTTRSRPLTT